MRRTRSVSAEEAKLWRTAMRNVTPYRPQPIPPEEPPVPPPVKVFAESAPPAPPAPKPNGIDRQTFRHLAKGERTVEATIDLHGMTLQAAHSALRRFIE